MGSTGTLYERRERYHFSNSLEDVVVRSGTGELKRVLIGQVTSGANIDVRDSTTVSGGELIFSIEASFSPLGSHELEIPVSGGISISNNGSVASVFTLVYE